MDFDQIVNGIPLIFVVMGLVEFVKAFGVQGNALTAKSNLTGTADIAPNPSLPCTVAGKQLIYTNNLAR